MDYMTNSEKQWAKDNGLKKTNWRTTIRGNERIVFMATDGKLYYRDKNQYCGTYKVYCYTIG